MQATIDKKLSNCIPVWFEDRAAVTVVMASEGYPGSYAKGLEIAGMNQSYRIPSAAFSVFPFHRRPCEFLGTTLPQKTRVLALTSLFLRCV